MAIDFTKPATTDNYSTAFVPNIQANQIALAQWLESGVVTITGTPPINAKRINTTSGLIEFYNGSVWGAYAMGYVKKAGDTMTGLLTAPVGLALNGAATLPAATAGGLFSFETPVIREYIGDGTGYSRAWSKRVAGVTTDLMKLSDAGTLTVSSTSSIANWGSSTVAGSFSTYYKGATITAVGYIGTDGGALIAGGTGLNFGIRAESALYLMSAAGAKLLVFDAAGTLYPNVTNAYALGGTSNRWSQVAGVIGDFSGTMTIGSSLTVNSSASFPAANAGLEIGSNTATNTPFIDFHTMNRAGDYDARIIASGGGAGDGLGLLNLIAASVGIDCIPSGFKLDLGTSGVGTIGGVGNIGGYSDAGAYTIWAGRSSLNGAYVQLYGSAHATNPSLLILNGSKIQDAAGNELGYRGLPSASVTTGAFVAADRGKCVFATAGVTVPNATMAAGDVVVIQNTTAAAITITATVTTLRLTGTALTGNRTLAAYGSCAIKFQTGTLAYASGDLS